MTGPKHAERDQTAPHEGECRGGVHFGRDAADQPRVGEHRVGVRVGEDHTAHPVPDREPGHADAERDDGSDDFTARDKGTHLGS